VIANATFGVACIPLPLCFPAKQGGIMGGGAKQKPARILPILEGKCQL